MILLKLPKTTSKKTALILNILLIALGLLFGLRYILSSELMPYHLKAMGLSNWNHVIPAYKYMVLTFMKVAGLGMCSVSIGVSIFLFSGLKKNGTWSRLNILLLFCSHYIPLTIIISFLKIKTPASPPLVMNIIALCIAIVAFIFSKNESKLITNNV